MTARALTFDGLTKHYGNTVGVDSLSLSVASGEVFGFLGPNGAGKTTTIRTLMGFQSPTSGTATILGHDVRDEADLVEAKRRVGYLPSSLAFDETATGREILDYHGAVKGNSREETLLDEFSPPLSRRVREYSSGNKQMLGIVQAFMHDPDVVVMDEPTSGLDPLKQERFNEYVRAERRRGTTIFFSSHVLAEVRRVCDRVGILRAGRLVTVEPVEELLDRSGKRVRVELAGDVDPGAFAVAGVHDVERRDGGDTRGEEHANGDEPARTTTLSFTFTGEYNDLVSLLAAYDVRDLNVEEAPLEDVFMRFYGEDDA